MPEIASPIPTQIATAPGRLTAPFFSAKKGDAFCDMPMSGMVTLPSGKLLVPCRATPLDTISMTPLPIADLWESKNPKDWEDALEYYSTLVEPVIIERERALEAPDLLERLRLVDSKGWYEFLKDDYFRWKYTDARFYKWTTRELRRYVDQGALNDLDQIRRRLLNLDTDDTHSALNTACEIRGLGAAGASGLLALMYPRKFGTVDQFVVKALRQVRGLPEAEPLTRMYPTGLTIMNGVLLIEILRSKAADLNRILKSDQWTPRKVEKVLWIYDEAGIPRRPRLKRK